MNRIRTSAALLLLTVALTACQQSADTKETSDTQIDSIAETTTSEVESTEVLDSFPDADYTGMTYTVMSRPVNKADINQIAPETLNGEIINDAIFHRNEKILDKYGVTVEWLERDEESYVLNFTNAVMAEDDSFQFAAVHVIQAGTLASQGLLLDMNELPHIDMTQPWWNQNARESLTGNGKTYIGQNDIPTYMVICSNHIMYYNKDIAEEYGIPDINQLVRDGDWTMDKLYELSGLVSDDLDGNSIMDENDLWGLITTTGSTSIFLPSCDQAIMENDENGIPQLVLNTPKTADIVERVYKLCVESGQTLMSDISHEVEYCELFCEGHCLFYNGYVADMNMMRDMDDQFGLIPPPKYDENQEEYYTLIQGSSDLVAIPRSLPEKKYEFVGLITEALAAVSYYDVRPAIYEGAIKNKYMRDVDSEEMLDMITHNIVVDFGFVNNGGFAFPIWNLMDEKSSDFASYYAAREASVISYNEKLLEQY